MLQIFTDGEKFFEKYTKKYKVHKKGFFILAPSGSGKTYFVKNQKQLDWIDGDELWTDAGAQPETDWWNQGLDVIFSVDQKCDIITKQATDLGLCIIGASNYWLIPDAVVLPDWRINKKYIIAREKGDYDGGAKSSDFDQVIGHRKVIKELAVKNKIPIYKTIEEAVKNLISK